MGKDAPLTEPLTELSSTTGCEFPNLVQAREDSREKLEQRRRALNVLGPDLDASVIYMGSIGRLEATDGSDDDFMLLVDRRVADDTESSLTIGRVRSIIKRLPDSGDPGEQGIFGSPVHLRDLVYNIGLTADDNSNTTRRMLFLLESDWAFGEECYRRSFTKITDRYLDKTVKDKHPPRFMLNDVVRYWRTMCVDFAGKARQGPEKWGLRNAKLVTSRKTLFAGGLLPILDCHRLNEADIRRFLPEQLSMCPTDRIAASFIRNGMPAEGARALRAYDEFVGLLSVPANRQELEGVQREDASSSELFAEVRDIGNRIQDELLTLLLDSEELGPISRRYAIF